MSAPPDSLVAGTSAAKARKLIGFGWTVTEAGLWTNGLTDACDAETALRVAESLSKTKVAAPAPLNWWTHLAGTMRGTVGIGLLTALIPAIVANPPPEIGLSPTVVAYLKWGIPLLGTILLGTQVPASMKAAVATPAPAPESLKV